MPDENAPARKTHVKFSSTSPPQRIDQLVDLVDQLLLLHGIVVRWCASDDVVHVNLRDIRRANLKYEGFENHGE